MIQNLVIVLRTSLIIATGLAIVAASVYAAIGSQEPDLCQWLSSNSSSIAASRAEIYLSLSSLYLMPAGSEHIMLLQSASSSRLFNISGTSDSNRLKTDFKHLGDVIQEHLSSTERRTRLSIEWTKLFRGVKPGYSPLPPYESLYRDGWLIGSHTTDIRDEYFESGFNLSNQWPGEPPDHIGLELGYLFFLSSREAEAWAEADIGEAHRLLDIESSFLKKHLAVWTSLLSEEIKQYDEIGFYRQVAEISEAWIRFDSELLAEHTQCVEPRLSH